MNIIMRSPGAVESILRTLERTRLIAVIRGNNLKNRANNIAMALVSAGVAVMEVTLNSPDALDAIETIREKADTSVILGAGTVLSVDQVKQAFNAGAEFIVSPNMSPSVIRETKKLGMASFPGCFTASEIVDAFAHGADAVKVFPATAFSPASLHALRSSLGDLRLIPTGGVTLENAPHYLDAGAWALGVGSELVDLRQPPSPLEEAIRERAVRWVSVIEESHRRRA